MIKRATTRIFARVIISILIAHAAIVILIAGCSYFFV